MAFHFPLEPVLRLRLGQERVERLKLETIVSEQGQTRARLEEVTRSSFESRRRFQQELSNTLCGSELQFEFTRQARVSFIRAALQVRLVDLEKQRLAQAQTYSKIRLSREALENLRQRKFDLYRVEQSRHEQQDLDDLFLMRKRFTRDD
jgi:flagellar export protein FliJ